MDYKQFSQPEKCCAKCIQEIKYKVYEKCCIIVVKECPSCGCECELMAQECPSCGYVSPRMVKKSEIVMKPGRMRKMVDDADDTCCHYDY